MVEKNTNNLHPYIQPIQEGPISKEKFESLTNSINQEITESIETISLAEIRQKALTLCKKNKNLDPKEMWEKLQSEIPTLQIIVGVERMDNFDGGIELFSNEKTSITGNFELLDSRFKIIKHTKSIYIEENTISFVDCVSDFSEFNPSLSEENNITEITFESNGDTIFSAPAGKILTIGTKTIKSGSMTFDKNGEPVDEDFDHGEIEVEVE